MPLTNWAGNIAFQFRDFVSPTTPEELQAVVRDSPRVKVVGSRHSFSAIADGDAVCLSLKNLQPSFPSSEGAEDVWVDGRLTYGEVCEVLHSGGRALRNMASLPHISVVGACQTATHGSGVSNANLASAVSGIQMITADGSLLQSQRGGNGARFPGMVVGLGCLGVVTGVSLATVPTYRVRQDIYENLPLGTVEERLDKILGGGYSVSLFTDWQAAHFTQVWRKRIVPEDAGESSAAAAESEESDWHGAARATRRLHPIAGKPSDFCTEQGGVVGAWHERLPHFRREVVPSSGDELQSEYFVGREDGRAALRAVAGMREAIAPLLLVSEIRTVAKDSLWLSPCYERDALAIHFTWRKDSAAVARLLPQIEAALSPFAARPHWGKLFTLSPAQVRALYPRFDDFARLRAELDPTGKFLNDFLRGYFA